MARKFKPGVDEFVERGEFTLKVLEVHKGGEVTIRNQFGFPERVSVEDLSPANPEKIEAIKRRAEGGRPNR